MAVLPQAEHIGENPARLASCGRPLPLVSMKIVDPQGNEVEHGVVGELMIRTPMAFSGYWNRPQATAEVMEDGWYRSGDMGFVMRRDSSISLTARRT